jgi:hypothetical protein
MKRGDKFYFNLDAFMRLHPGADEDFVNKMKNSSRIIEYLKGVYPGTCYTWVEAEQDGVWPEFFFALSDESQFITPYEKPEVFEVEINIELLEELW